VPGLWLHDVSLTGGPPAARLDRVAAAVVVRCFGELVLAPVSR